MPVSSYGDNLCSHIHVGVWSKGQRHYRLVASVSPVHVEHTALKTRNTSVLTPVPPHSNRARVGQANKEIAIIQAGVHKTCHRSRQNLT